MNRDEYRRALIMLRSLKAGVSGYIRLERRTLMGTLQFTVNGINGNDAELYAVLLCRSDGSWRAIRLSSLNAPRYGQTGLLWKFDPRNIEGRTLEQYDLAAVVERRSGICDLLLCGNLNGTMEVDWAQVRDAACRLFTPVRVSGTPIAPIVSEDESQTTSDVQQADLCTADSAEESSSAESNSAISTPDDAVETQAAVPVSETEVPTEHPEESAVTEEPAALEDIAVLSREIVESPSEPETIDSDPLPAEPSPQTAGELLELDDPNAAWPESIEPLRSLFFSREVIIPFEADGYIFIQAPLPEETGMDSCAIGLLCGDGKPTSVCYAIPASYTPEPPPGLEGYVWRGDQSHGYWTICEHLSNAD